MELRVYGLFRFAKAAQAGMCALTAMDPTRIVRSRILISMAENLPRNSPLSVKEGASKNRSNWGGKTTGS